MGVGGWGGFFALASNRTDYTILLKPCFVCGEFGVVHRAMRSDEVGKKEKKRNGVSPNGFLRLHHGMINNRHHHHH